MDTSAFGFNMLWFGPLYTKDQVERMLRAEDLITADKANHTIDSLKSTVAQLRFGGKIIKISGIVFAVLSVPCMLFLVGFLFLPVAIGAIWFGARAGRRANEQDSILSAGLAAHLAQLATTG
jgi:hypothetical protein